MLLERSVQTVRVVVLDVLAQHCGEVAQSSDQQVIESFVAQGAEEAFGDRVRPRCPYRVRMMDVGVGEHCIDGTGERAVPIVDQEPERWPGRQGGLVGCGFHHLVDRHPSERR
jgi:hypothetical protein